MTTLVLWRMTIKRPGRLLRLRQYCRQVTSLLGFGALERVTLGTAVFGLAWRIMERRSPVRVVFQLRGPFLEIRVAAAGHARSQASQGGPWQLTKKLPPQNFCPEDVAWIVRQSLGQEKVSLVAEMVKQNQELLELLEQLGRGGQGQLPLRIVGTEAA